MTWGFFLKYMKIHLPQEYYSGNDALPIAVDLIGKLIVYGEKNTYTSGIIVETEAYLAPNDKASHAYNNRMTTRTKTMFEPGGTAYIYLVYGMNHLFNVVTGPAGLPHAILIRAVEPVDGIDIMMQRRKKKGSNLTNGPGKWTSAMGITIKNNGLRLYEHDSYIKIYDVGNKYSSADIISSPRVGIHYAGEFVEKPWRFRLIGNAWAGR